MTFEQQRLLCPNCSAPMLDRNDDSTFEIEQVSTGAITPSFFWAVSCGKCGKLLGILPAAPSRSFQ